jgi:large subunit ribosomal protein L13
MEHIIDAKGKRLGRVASEIAVILQGKKSPKYERNRVSNDQVIVKNADKITLSGNKAKTKVYYHHTGYMGHLKELPYELAFKKDPKKVLREAVKHMLPKNFLNKRRIINLKFSDAD